MIVKFSENNAKIKHLALKSYPLLLNILKKQCLLQMT